MSDETLSEVTISLPSNLAALRDGAVVTIPSHVTEKRKQKILALEQEQAEIFALMEDLQRVRDHLQSAPQVGTRAVPLVSMKIRQIRHDLGEQVEANRAALNFLRSKV